jgi:membrane associated rhomboid family serine protease
MRSQAIQGGMPRPGKVVITLLGVTVGAYILELVLLRMGVPILEWLALTPSDVVGRGYVWQLATAALLHSPSAVGHLLMNMLGLWMFGAPLEQWWGGRRVLIAYVVCALAGAVFTVLVAALSLTPVLSWLLPGFWDRPHVGASGATLGLTIAWGMVFAKQPMNFMFLGQMTGRTFVMIMIAIQLLVALSFDNTSSTSHFGGMIGGYLLVSGHWRPSRWAQLWQRSKLVQKKKRLERELRLIEGGKGKNPDDELPN